MHYSSDKDLNKYVKVMVKKGWRYENGKKHARLIHPDGRPFVTIPKSPGGCRGTLNVMRNIRDVLRNK